MIATDLIQLGGRFGLNLILLVSAALVFGREILRNHALTPLKRLLWGLAFFIPTFPGFLAYQLAWSKRREQLSYGFGMFVVAETAALVFVGIVVLAMVWPSA